MLTGTDEHGQKMMRAAAANGATPQEWVDKLVGESWFPLLETLDVANDDFIRTTQPRHEERVRRFVQAISTAATSTPARSRRCTVSGARSSRPRPRSATAGARSRA